MKIPPRFWAEKQENETDAQMGTLQHAILVVEEGFRGEEESTY